MRHAPWLTSAIVLALSGSALAVEADGAASAVSTQATGQPALVAPIPSAADLSFQQAINSLHQERQAFVQSFDWNKGEREVLRGEYSVAMDRLELRELELKRDWHQATGRLEQLAQVQAAIERKVNPPRHLPEIQSARSASIPAQDQGKEMSR